MVAAASGDFGAAGEDVGTGRGLFETDDAGKSWQRQDRGFPKKQGWFTVKRQAFCRDNAKPVGLYLGTTSGEVWASTNEGAKFQQIAAHLPEIYSVEAVERL